MTDHGKAVIFYEIVASAFLLVTLSLTAAVAYLNGEVRHAIEIATGGAVFSISVGLVFLAGAIAHLGIGIWNWLGEQSIPLNGGKKA